MAWRHKEMGPELVSPDEIQARRQGARWALALMECNIPIDDDFFAFVGWLLGGVENLATQIRTRLPRPTGRTREATHARNTLDELATAPPLRLDDYLADLYRENPSMQKPIRDLLTRLIAPLAPESFRLADVAIMGRLKRLFGLGNLDLELCFFVFCLGQFRLAERFLEDGLELGTYAKRELLGHLLGVTGAEIYSSIKGLETMGILERRHSSLRLADSIQMALLVTRPSQVRDLFCRKLPKATVALKDFHLDPDTVAHAFKLLERSTTGPTHLLLYGAPGTGKSTFAASLAQELKVKAWAVPCGEKDSTQDRRASLAACLRLAADHPGAFVLVDEAERILDTSRGDSEIVSAKAWINELLERKKTRIVWITNYVEHLDAAVRRRFSYSIHFEEPGLKERKRMWASVATRLHAETLLPPELQARLATRYEVPIATMELAARQAKSLGGKKGFAAAIERILDAQVALRHDGMKPRHLEDSSGFDTRGIAARMDLESLLRKARRMGEQMEKKGCQGMGTMLFYGPPGTGKTALGRHLARQLDREVLVRRASDLLGPYVGESEMKIAAAFHQAERTGALLIIDEADSFLQAREGASHSWEQTMTNEFLTCLETFRGMCICTTNFRKVMDSAAMRRFTIKLEFTYAGPDQCQWLYRSLLAPLVDEEPGADIWAGLRQQRHLAPGDFAAVKLRMWLEDGLTHRRLLDELLLEQRLKLERESKTVGF